MLTTGVRIVIPGDPAGKGSLRCVGKRGKVNHVLLEASEKSGPWRKKVADACSRYLMPTYAAAPGQPIAAELTFTLQRPQSHTGTGRNAGVLKASAPVFPVGHNTGDLDKLVRLLLDALQDATVLPDDCAVVDIVTRKVFTSPAGGGPWYDANDVLEHPGVVIRLRPVEGP